MRSLIPWIRKHGDEVALLLGEEGPAGRNRVDDLAAEAPCWLVSSLGRNAALDKIQGWRPEVVYHHGLRDMDLEEELAVRFPGVLFGHGFYGTCATGTKCHLRPQVEPCERRFGPACLAINYWRGCGANDPRALWRTYSTQRRRQRLFARYESIIVASRYMAEELGRNTEDAVRTRVRVVPLPVVGWSARAQVPDKKQRTGRVAFVGRVTRYKGCDVLVAAMARAQKQLGVQLTLVIAGTGPWFENVDRLAREQGLAMESSGWQTTEKIEALLDGVDLLALPSLWPEPFGLVGLEAGALGVPTVGFGVGGVPDWLETGVNGACVSPTAGVAGLTDALVGMLSDDTYRHRQAVGAWERSRSATMERHWNEIRSELVSAVEARRA